MRDLLLTAVLLALVPTLAFAGPPSKESGGGDRTFIRKSMGFISEATVKASGALTIDYESMPCSGSFSGTLVRIGDTMHYAKPDGESGVETACVLLVQIGDGFLTVQESPSCAPFHGHRCDFDGHYLDMTSLGKAGLQEVRDRSMRNRSFLMTPVGGLSGIAGVYRMKNSVLTIRASGELILTHDGKACDGKLVGQIRWGADGELDAKPSGDGEDVESCFITIWPNGEVFRVEESGCEAYHGDKCSFVGDYKKAKHD